MNVRSLLLSLVAFGALSAAAGVADLEDLSVPPAGFVNHPAFSSGGALFSNTFTDFGGGFSTWSGWAYSNKQDSTNPGFDNQYSAFPGGAAGGSNYAIGYVSAFDPPPVITLPDGTIPLSIDLANTTYAALSMRDGDQFAKKFGGPTGNDPDYLLLTITGLDAANGVVGELHFYMADYRFADSRDDYILDSWRSLDLSSLAGARSLSFSMTSTDVDPFFGINTPTYFAADNLVTAVPEVNGLLLVAAAAGFAMFFGVRRRTANEFERRAVASGELAC